MKFLVIEDKKLLAESIKEMLERKGFQVEAVYDGETVETKTVDIGNDHISVEIDGGKASGSMDDIKPGTFVTITMNSKGEVTNVLVSSRSFE